VNDLNSTLIEGNLTRDPESKHTTGGTCICRLSMASNRSYKKGEAWEKEVSYFEIDAWGKLGENCAAHLKKGRGVRVVGRLKQERWADKDGKVRSAVKVIAESIEFKPEYKKDGETVTQEAKGNQSDFNDDIPF
jgi:single-strand DNA-binding protein